MGENLNDFGVRKIFPKEDTKTQTTKKLLKLKTFILQKTVKKMKR